MRIARVHLNIRQSESFELRIHMPGPSVIITITTVIFAQIFLTLKSCHINNLQQKICEFALVKLAPSAGLKSVETDLQDGDELLNEEDMIDVFNRLWKLAANMDAAQKRGKVV